MSVNPSWLSLEVVDTSYLLPIKHTHVAVAVFDSPRCPAHPPINQPLRIAAPDPRVRVEAFGSSKKLL